MRKENTHAELIIGNVKLSNGEEMLIKLLRPPAPEYFDPIWDHQIHMNGNDFYKRIFKQRLEGKYAAECTDSYFIGEIDGEIAGLIWYGYPVNGTGVGNWGDVLTTRKHRGKGVMKTLIDAFMDDFLLSSAKILLCSANPHAMNSYAKIGWKSILQSSQGGGPSYLIHPNMLEHGTVGKDFREFSNDYFSPGRKTSVYPGSMRHRHDIDRLLSFSKILQLTDTGENPEKLLSVQDVVLDRRMGITYNIKNYMDAIFRMEDGNGIVTVMTTDKGNVVGWAFCLSLGSELEKGNKYLDYSIHPNYASSASLLINETLCLMKKQQADTIYAYCPNIDTEKKKAFNECGFHENARMKNYCKIDGNLCDMELLCVK